MNCDEILIGNKKIAQFMGYTYFPHNMEGVKHPGWKTTIDTDWSRKHNTAYNFISSVKKETNLVERKYLCRGHNDLKYHSDWNWLMEVIVHIQTIEKDRFYISVDPWSMTVVDYIDSPENEVVTCQFDYDESLNMRYFNTILEFIDWYNKNK